MRRLIFSIMKLHRNLVDAVIEGLTFIFNEGQYADKVVEKQLKKDKRWGARDRAFIAETIYDIVRWKRLYAEIAEVYEPFTVHNLRRMLPCGRLSKVSPCRIGETILKILLHVVSKASSTNSLR